jgi:four helix bundle protein
MAQDLSTRTLSFALNIIKLFSSLPKTTEAQILGQQLLRCGTSVGAHYREGSRARSKAEFVAKIEGGLQELEETGYWLELLLLSGIIKESQVSELLQEVKELTAIFITVAKNTKAQMK